VKRLINFLRKLFLKKSLPKTLQEKSQKEEIVIKPKEEIKKEELIVKEPEKKIFVNDNIIVKKIGEINFIFDKDSYKEFEEFDDYLHNILVKNGYLARELKCDKRQVTFFHRWYMQREIDKKKIKYDTDRIEVHHIFTKRDNRRSNFIITDKYTHRKILHGFND